LKRGEADVKAIKKALEALQMKKIVVIAPEGTRSGHGCLQKAHPGVVLLALRSGAPVMPLVYFGGEQFNKQFKQLQRTDFHIEVGRPFFLDARGEKVDKHVRSAMLDEIMYQLAALMPEKYRGIYADLTRATQTYLRFVDSPVISQ
jgi:1-acyl-sn-glycerol-3-phosphate acyltransferase